MKLLKQLWILIFIYFLGEFISNIFSLPLPGNVMGFVFMVIALKSNIIKPEMIEDVTDFFLKNLAIFFIPGGVGLLQVTHLFNGNIIKILLIVVISTILTFVTTAGTIILMEKLKK